MSVSIDEFCNQMKSDIEAFYLYWLSRNVDDEEGYPLEFDNSNAGIWYEMFEAFLSSRDSK